MIPGPRPAMCVDCTAHLRAVSNSRTSERENGAQWTAEPVHDPLTANKTMAEAVRNPKVLIIDDEPNIRELVQVALNFHGFAVTTGATGDDALDLADAYHPDASHLSS